MKTSAKFKEYIWLVNTISEYKRITFSEIQKLWLETDMSEGVELARSTFNRHKDAIEDIFGIYIVCDKRDGFRYRIGNSEVLKEDSIQNWMLSTLSVHNIISESLSLQNRVLLESVPCEGDYLRKVIEAMKKNLRIKVKYQKYGTDEVKVLEFAPYCIKLLKQRWYILGHFHRPATDNREERDFYAIFSLDRINEIELTDIQFRIPEEFTAKDYFSESYGVYVDEKTQPENVIVRAYGKERYYLRDLPVHPSQKEIKQGEDFSDFSLYLKPTMDFCGYILGRSNQLQVISPQWLRDKVAGMIQSAMKLYEP